MASLVDFSHAKEEDLPAIARLAVTAQKTDLVTRTFLQPGEEERLERELIALFTRELSSPNAGIVKASLKGSGEVVAYAYAYFQDAMKEGENGNPEQVPACSPSAGSVPSTLASLVKKKRHDLMGGRPHWVAKHLMVHPSWHRRGIGRALLSFALDHINHDSLPIYLDSSISGAQLYQKMGWRVIGTVTLEDVEGATGDREKGQGAEEGFVSRCMVASFPRSKL